MIEDKGEKKERKAAAAEKKATFTDMEKEIAAFHI